MRFRLTFVVIVLAALATGGPSAQSKELDNSTITCREFLASGQANMAALLTWLRGYHASKTGIIPFQSPGPYGGRPGFYCKQNPDANLIDASEQFLTTIDHDI
jgi:acid stress chaperone HdeB